MLGRERRFAVLVIFVGVIVTAIVLFAPIVPVEFITTQTRIRPLWYNDQYYNETGAPLYVNVTNTDSLAGVFSVTMRLSEGKPVVGGVEFETKETTTISLFIDAGATEKFSSPEEWMPLESIYAFFYFVSAATTQEKYNVTRTECKTIISIIGNW